MARYWRILSTVIGVTLTIPVSARPTTIDQTCTAARASAVRGAAQKPVSREMFAFDTVIDNPACTSAMSNVEKMLCLMLLGCLAVVGNQASRRKAIKAVAS